MRLPALVLVTATACSPASPGATGTPGESAELPRLPASAGADALVQEAIDRALKACENGEEGALIVLGETYDANELPGLARRAYELALAKGAGADEARLHTLLAGVLEREGQPEAALEHLAEAAELAPDAVPILWRQGGLLLDLGRLEEAAEPFERALAAEPLGLMQRLGKARLALLSGAPREALATLEPLAASQPRARFVHGLMARAHRALGDEQAAALELRREARANVTPVLDPWGGRMQGRATGLLTELERIEELVSGGDAGTALEHIERLRPRFPGTPALERARVRARLEQGAVDGAQAALEDARAAGLDAFQLALLTGSVAAARGDHRAALDARVRATEANPGFGPAWADRGESELAVGRAAEAESSLTRALDLGTDDPRTRLLLGRAQMALSGRDPDALARARATIEECTREFPRSAPAWSHLAELQLQLGELAAARESLEAAARWDPEHPGLGALRARLEAQESEH
jgi:tetratricopeptide (TPR) repeat protein